MNASMTRKPTAHECHFALLVSKKAEALVLAYESEVGSGQEWPNKDNINNTRTHLLAYIGELEQKTQVLRK